MITTTSWSGKASNASPARRNRLAANWDAPQGRASGPTNGSNVTPTRSEVRYSTSPSCVAPSKISDFSVSTSQLPSIRVCACMVMKVVEIARVLSHGIPPHPQYCTDLVEAYAMTRTKAYQKRQAKARQRRRRNPHERFQRDQAHAQRAAQALEQALQELALPQTLVQEIEGRLRSQQRLLAKIFGLMFPTLFGCRTTAELSRVRGGDKNLPSRLLGALPKRSWIKRLRRLGVDVLIPLWRHAASKSEATRSRWQWTWVADDSVFKKYGEQLGLVGTWWSGQEHRVLSGIDGVLLVVVIGEGKLVVPVDFAIRRPDPQGPGGPCQDKRHWVQVMLDGRVAALRRCGV